MATLRKLILILPLLLILIALLAVMNGAAQQKSHKFLVYVGTYTGENSKGIYAYRFDSDSGKVTPLGLAAESDNPSFLVVHPGGHFLYAVNEIGSFRGKPTGAVSAFAIDRRNGALKPLNQISSEGAGPAHISLDKTGHYALVANYDGGSVAAISLKTDGRLDRTTAFVQHRGSSVDPERQASPHAHAIVTAHDDRFALAADLGLDKVLVYQFDSSTGSLVPDRPPFVTVHPGAGPRHIAFHPSGRFAYVNNEIASTINVFSYDEHAGSLKTIQTVSSMLKDSKVPNDTAEIAVHPNGHFLYVSNRGHDSITVFRIDATSGKLTGLEEVPTGGKTPRNFAFDPTTRWLWAANQDSDNIVLFRVDAQSGGINSSGIVLPVASPVCVAFVAME